MSDKSCSAKVYGPRVHSWGCTRKGVVKRGGQWYCKTHDPEAVKARRDKRDADYREESAKSERILADAVNLAGRLGCGEPHFDARGFSWSRHLVITFEDAERLIERLKP